jgi:hypothetical protein
MPISRVGEPVDVSNLCAFLLSDDASWMTGQCIGVDGGHTIRKGPDLVPLFSQAMPTESQDTDARRLCKFEAPNPLFGAGIGSLYVILVIHMLQHVDSAEVYT